VVEKRQIGDTDVPVVSGANGQCSPHSGDSELNRGNTVPWTKIRFLAMRESQLMIQEMGKNLTMRKRQLMRKETENNWV
jgi:hypothetical protein